MLHVVPLRSTPTLAHEWIPLTSVLPPVPSVWLSLCSRLSLCLCVYPAHSSGLPCTGGCFSSSHSLFDTWLNTAEPLCLFNPALCLSALSSCVFCLHSNFLQLPHCLQGLHEIIFRSKGILFFLTLTLSHTFTCCSDASGGPHTLETYGRVVWLIDWLCGGIHSQQWSSQSLIS